ncbi:MAG: hypothetical protein ABI717_05705, partial [Actinomycetota bacterium]
VTIYHVGEQLPSYYELQATINAVKPTAGWKANSYVIFDYQSPTDFKFAGINVSLDKIQLGHRDQSGWVVDTQASNVRLRADTYYNVLVAVNGLVVTVTVDNQQSFSYAFGPRMIDGIASNLNWGYVGFGSENARGKLDNVQVKVLERPFTLQTTETFDDGTADMFTGLKNGSWQVAAGRYDGAISAGADPALSLMDLGLPQGIQANARTELSATLKLNVAAGFVFDLYSTTDFKFVLIDAVADKVLIGHRSYRGWSVDVSAALVLNPAIDYKLLISLAGSTVSVMVDDRAVVGHAFNAVVVDGGFGTMTQGGTASFNDFTLKTSDSRFRDPAPEMLLAATTATGTPPADGTVTQAQLAPIIQAASQRWSTALGGGDVAGAMAGIVFAVGDLKGQALAQTVGRVVMIDLNGAGHGWFIDSTPLDDKEFPTRTAPGELRAQSSSLAFGRNDLLTAVMHEIGHVLGFEHNTVATDPDVMTLSLPTGMRRLPIEAKVHVNGGTPGPSAALATPSQAPTSSASSSPGIQSTSATTISSEPSSTSASGSIVPAPPGRSNGLK